MLFLSKSDHSTRGDQGQRKNCHHGVSSPGIGRFGRIRNFRSGRLDGQNTGIEDSGLVGAVLIQGACGDTDIAGLAQAQAGQIQIIHGGNTADSKSQLAGAGIVLNTQIPIDKANTRLGNLCLECVNRSSDVVANDRESRSSENLGVSIARASLPSA